MVPAQTTCSILLIDDETTKNDIEIALAKQSPIFSHHWLSRVSSSNQRQTPRLTVPPEVSLDNCAVIFDENIGDKSSSEASVKTLGANIVDNSSSENYDRKFTALSVTCSVDKDKDRNRICLQQFLDKKHLPLCDVTHFPVNFATDLRYNSAILLVEPERKRNWLSDSLIHAGIVNT